ncbi:major facilitator superfamily domain-containing protein [Amylostereum chailletii]|nr:major facilitator superfamily domain-containing protein [Amylostereum chailletii]
MSTEETPLLGNALESTPVRKHDVVYNRFSNASKWRILVLVSFNGLIPFFVGGTFVPSIPQIAREFNTTGAVVNLAVGLSIIAMALGALTWATYAGFYGRRPVYLAALPILTVGSLGVSTARSIPELMVWRFIQAFGSGAGVSLGAGVIADIYRLEERGRAMGIFFGACLLGPALAPPLGGLAAHMSSWRAMQGALCVAGVVQLVSVYSFLPETSQPHSRGIDKLRDEDRREGVPPRKCWFVLNPFKSLTLLRSPNILAVTIVATCILISDYLMLIPLSYTIGNRYNIHNEALIGLFFLPAGVGNALGAPLAGRMSDTILTKWKRQRGDIWVPEDRLRASIFGMLVLVPIPMAVSGAATRYVSGTPGIVINLVCLFINGVGVDFSMTPMAAYIVDVLHAQSAEAMAATQSSRSVFIALTVAGMLPLIEKIGVLATYALSATVIWASYGLLWCTIRYGDRMRAWTDVGYSTSVDN